MSQTRSRHCMSIEDKAARECDPPVRERSRWRGVAPSAAFTGCLAIRHRAANVVFLYLTAPRAPCCGSARRAFVMPEGDVVSMRHSMNTGSDQEAVLGC